MRKYNKYIFGRQANPEDENSTPKEGVAADTEPETLDEALAKIRRGRIEIELRRGTSEEEYKARREAIERSLLQRGLTALAVSTQPSEEPATALTKYVAIAERDPIFYEIAGRLEKQDAESVKFFKDTANSLLAMAGSIMTEAPLNKAIADYEAATEEGTVAPGDQYLADFAELAKGINRAQKLALEGAARRNKEDELKIVTPLINQLKDLEKTEREIREKKREIEFILNKPADTAATERDLRTSIQRSGKFTQINDLIEEIEGLKSDIKKTNASYSGNIRKLESERERARALFVIIDNILFKPQSSAKLYPELKVFLEDNATLIKDIRNKEEIRKLRTGVSAVKENEALNSLKDKFIAELSDYKDLPESIVDYVLPGLTILESIPANRELINSITAQIAALSSDKLQRMNLLEKELEGKKAELDSSFKHIIYDQPLSELSAILSVGVAGGKAYYSNLYVEIEECRGASIKEAKDRKTKNAQLINLSERAAIIAEQITSLENKIKKLRLEKTEEQNEILSRRERELNTAALEYAAKIVNAKAEDGIYGKKRETDYEELMLVLRQFDKDKGGDKDISDNFAVTIVLEKAGLGFSRQDINKIIAEPNAKERYELIGEIYKNITQRSGLKMVPEGTGRGREIFPNDFYDIIKASYEENSDIVREAVPVNYVFGEEAALLRPGTIKYFKSISEESEGSDVSKQISGDTDWQGKLAAEVAASVPSRFLGASIKAGSPKIILTDEGEKESDALVSTAQSGSTSVRLEYREQIEFIMQAIPKLLDNAKELLKLDFERFSLSGDVGGSSYNLSKREKLIGESSDSAQAVGEILSLHLPYLAAEELRIICEILQKSILPGEYISVAEDIKRLERRAKAGFYPAALLSNNNRADYLKLFETFDSRLDDKEKKKAMDSFCESVTFARPLAPGIDNFYRYLVTGAAAKKAKKENVGSVEQGVVNALEKRTRDAYVLIVKACSLLKDRLSEYSGELESILGSDPCKPAIRNILDLYEEAAKEVKTIQRLGVRVSNKCPLASDIKNELSRYSTVRIEDNDDSEADFLSVRQIKLTAEGDNPQKYLNAAIPALFKDSKSLLEIITYGLATSAFWSVLRYGSGKDELNSKLYETIKVTDIDNYIDNLYRASTATERSESFTKYENVGGYLITRKETEPKLKADKLDEALRILMDRVILSGNRKIVPGTNIYNFAASLIIKHVIRDLYKNTWGLVSGTGERTGKIKGSQKYKMISELQNPEKVWEVCSFQAFEALLGREDWTVNGERPLKVRPHELYKEDEDGNYVATGKQAGFVYRSDDPKSPTKGAIIGYINKFVLKELDRITNENIYTLTGGVAVGDPEVTVRKGARTFVMDPSVAPRDISQKAIKQRKFDHGFREYTDDRGEKVYTPWVTECYEILKRYVVIDKSDLMPKMSSEEDRETGEKRDILDRYTYKGETAEEQARNKNNLKKAINDYETVKVVEPKRQLTTFTDDVEREAESGREDIDYEAQVQQEQALRRQAEQEGSVSASPETSSEEDQKALRRLELAKQSVAESKTYYERPEEGRVAEFIFRKYWTPSELDSSVHLTIEEIVEACRDEIGVEVKARRVEDEIANFNRYLQAELNRLYPGEYDLINGKLRVKKAAARAPYLVRPEDIRIFYKIDEQNAGNILEALYAKMPDSRDLAPFFEFSPTRAAQILLDKEILDVISSSVVEYYSDLLDYIEQETVKGEKVIVAAPRDVESARIAIREGEMAEGAGVPADIAEDYSYRVSTSSGKIPDGYSLEYYGGLATYDGRALSYNVDEIKDRLKKAITNMKEEKRSITSQIKDLANRLQKSAASGDKTGIRVVLGTELESSTGKNPNVATIADLFYAINAGNINLGEELYSDSPMAPQLVRSRKPFLEVAENLQAYLSKLPRRAKKK